MKRHIIITGPSRAGKSTLASRLSHELGYNMIRLDDLVSGFAQAFPQMSILHDSHELEVSAKLTGFICGILREMNDGRHVKRDELYVFEGVFIYLDVLFKEMGQDTDHFGVIGLHYSGLSEERLFEQIRAHDTDGDWTYYCDDEKLKGNCRYFLQRNNDFCRAYVKHGIRHYNVTSNRNGTFDQIIEEIGNRGGV